MAILLQTEDTKREGRVMRNDDENAVPVGVEAQTQQIVEAGIVASMMPHLLLPGEVSEYMFWAGVTRNQLHGDLRFCVKPRKKGRKGAFPFLALSVARDTIDQPMYYGQLLSREQLAVLERCILPPLGIMPQQDTVLIRTAALLPNYAPHPVPAGAQVWVSAVWFTCLWLGGVERGPHYLPREYATATYFVNPM